MNITYHELTVNDTLRPLGCQLQYEDSTGAIVNVNLTGLTVKFKMVADNGTVKVAETAATVIDPLTGQVQYDFQSADVNTAGIFWGWFIVFGGVGGLERDTYPVGRKLCIVIKQAA